MYKEFYGLSLNPFSLAPDPRFLFRTEIVAEAMANIQYGIENGKGLVLITGEAGTGKTTILRSMLQSVDRSIAAVYLFNPLLSTDEFFSLLANEFKLGVHSSKTQTLRLMGSRLMSRQSQGLRSVLVVDEAHLLPPNLLEEIRLLSNFETNREKLLQIVLCGQPDLRDLLAQPAWRNLKQRISLRCSVTPLNARETAHYISWRLRVAGAKQLSLFDPEALVLIQQFSGGIPRVINNICDNALLTGFSRSSPRITVSIVREVAELLDLIPTKAESPHASSFGMTGLGTSIAAGPQDDPPLRAREESKVSPIRTERVDDQPAQNVRAMRREDQPQPAAASAGASVPAGQGLGVVPRRYISRPLPKTSL
jgi:general secretion pathway protein A